MAAQPTHRWADHQRTSCARWVGRTHTFYNGVPYVYEKPYEHQTADAEHGQYCPDFYFPDIQTYLEHWALDEHGNPPAEFAGYREGINWKRNLHAQHGTRLLETTMAELWSGQLFEKLGRQLTELGGTLDPNPDRPVPGRQPIENPRLARTIRMFQTHVKNPDGHPNSPTYGHLKLPHLN